MLDDGRRLRYNILNKRAAAQCTSVRRQSCCKVVPYFTRAGALLFAFNKSNNGTQHNHKGEQFCICNHRTSSFQKKCPAAGVIALTAV